MLVLDNKKAAYLTADQIADELNVDQETVLRWLRRKELKGYKLGKLWRVYRADLETFLEERSNTRTATKE